MAAIMPFTPVPEWEVDFFIVATSALDAHTDRVYANGRMQIPVIVYLGAIDKKTSEPYNLQDLDLQKIELYDFDNPTQELSGDWNYDNARNPLFSNSIEINVGKKDDAPKEASPARAQVLGATNPSFRVQTFWVSASKVETKRIGARVRQPDNVLASTKYSVYNAFVKITAIEPVKYTLDNVSVDRQDTGNGNFNYFAQDADEGNWSVTAVPWDQDNYFVTSKVHPFVAADIHGADVTGYDDGHPADWRLANCYGFYSQNGKTLRLSFLWGLGTPKTTTVGLYKTATITNAAGEKVGRGADTFVNMKINNRDNSVCLTRLAFDCPDKIWTESWQVDNAGFTVYDVYGNTGSFAAGFDAGHNLVKVTNAAST